MRHGFLVTVSPNRAPAVRFASLFTLVVSLLGVITPPAQAQYMEMQPQSLGIQTRVVPGEEGDEESVNFAALSELPPAYRKLPEIESQLYGHAYPNQGLQQRINRVERTLFGNAQGGRSETRMRNIESRIHEQNSKEQLAGQEPMLAYLENKLFQRTYENRPLPERIHQLEVQVFGKSFDSYPTSVRLKKLTYAMPLMAKEIRLTKGDGVVLASTARMSRRNDRSGPPTVEKVQLDATRMTSVIATRPPIPTSEPVVTGSYIHAIHRNTDGTTLRWKTLPLHVYIKPISGESRNAVTRKALQAWKNFFPVETVSQSERADIIISWDAADWAQNATGLLTRPVMQIDAHTNLRTVILIHMNPLEAADPASQLHVLAHQLGHAFGLWGHSSSPEDIMYPLLKEELNDFPSRLAWRSGNLSEHIAARNRGESAGYLDEIAPSQRDMNTLLKIYDLPATDLSAYRLLP